MNFAEILCKFHSLFPHNRQKKKILVEKAQESNENLTQQKFHRNGENKCKIERFNRRYHGSFSQSATAIS